MKGKTSEGFPRAADGRKIHTSCCVTSCSEVLKHDNAVAFDSRSRKDSIGMSEGMLKVPLFPLYAAWACETAQSSCNTVHIKTTQQLHFITDDLEQAWGGRGTIPGLNVQFTEAAGSANGTHSPASGAGKLDGVVTISFPMTSKWTTSASQDQDLPQMFMNSQSSRWRCKAV